MEFYPNSASVDSFRKWEREKRKRDTHGQREREREQVTDTNGCCLSVQRQKHGKESMSRQQRGCWFFVGLNLW